MSLINEVRNGLAALEHSNKDLKKFALTMTVAFGIFATLIFFFGAHTERAWWLGGIGALFLLVGFLLPALLKPIHFLWMGLALVLGYFMSRILLTLLFFLVITPIGLLMRLLGKDIINTKLQPDAATYWIKREKKEISPEQYERLY